MSIVRILQYPDPRLHTKAKRVENVQDEAIQRVIDDMLETLNRTPNCAGLAATQLDFQDPVAITVIDLSPDRNEPLVLINPEIVETRGEVFEPEGCMSIEGVLEKVKRPAWAKLKAIDREGNPIEMEGEGFLAKCFQHEVDHLNGILYIEYLSPMKRQRLEKKMAKLQKTQKEQ